MSNQTYKLLFRETKVQKHLKIQNLHPEKIYFFLLGFQLFGVRGSAKYSFCRHKKKRFCLHFIAWQIKTKTLFPRRKKMELTEIQFFSF
jgi:hypothetical protein